MIVAESKVTGFQSQMDKFWGSNDLLNKLKSQGFKLDRVSGALVALGNPSVKEKVEVIDPVTGEILEDTEPPVLILHGNSTTELVLSADRGVQFEDPGASAIDQNDGPLSALVHSKLLNGTSMDLSSPTLPNKPYVIRFALCAVMNCIAVCFEMHVH
jgi:hypothetical protein